MEIMQIDHFLAVSTCGVKTWVGENCYPALCFIEKILILSSINILLQPNSALFIFIKSSFKNTSIDMNTITNNYFFECDKSI